MATLRILAESDVPSVVALFERVYPEHRWESRKACEAYFREMLFDNPWRDAELPSWVAEERGGIAGFAGLVPRRMLFRRRPVRVAVGCQFMVDPDQRHSLTALQLAKACISGPQDLTFVDGANDDARRMWVGIGGVAPLLYSLHWTRLLRPARYMLSQAAERSVLPRSLIFAMQPAGAVADALSVRLHPNRFHRQNRELTDGALDADAMLSHLPEVLNGSALQPVYDRESLAWLLNQTARKTRHGRLRARAVRDAEQRLVGWYLYYMQAGSVNEVVQVAARDGAFDSVLHRLLTDAWRHGAIAVRGRLDPHRVRELSHRHCWLRSGGSWTLVHSRDPEITAAVHRGDAFLSRLEGEWWLRFLGR